MNRADHVPAVSVVMPVYNEAAYVETAVESILAQTFRDFELVIVDNGSTDDSPNILSRMRDPRVRLFRNHVNLGSAAAGNRAVRESRAPLIARMDADDIALPHRLEKQIAAFAARPALALLGAQAHHFEEGPPFLRCFPPRALTPLGIAWQSLFASPFVHATVMFRRERFDAAGGYDERFPRSADFALFSRMQREGEVANLPDVLVRFRHRVRELLRDSEYEKLVRDVIGENIHHLLRPESGDARMKELVERWPDISLMLRRTEVHDDQLQHLPQFLSAFAGRIRELYDEPVAIREIERDANFALCRHAWLAWRLRHPSARSLVKTSLRRAPLFSAMFVVRELADGALRRIRSSQDGASELS